MKFKVGDKVRVIKEGTHNQEIGAIVTVLRVSDVSYYCQCPYNGNWYLKEDEVCAFKPTKKELLDMPLGTIIVTDAEEHNTFIKVGDDDWCNDNRDHLKKHNINEDLTIKGYLGTKIIEIREPDYREIYNYSQEVKEMTVTEIEKALGHAVKIVKEEK